MRKKGISAVVATVLIVLIVVAAAAFVWMGVVPVVDEIEGVGDAGGGIGDIGAVEIVTSGGYTLWDEEKGVLEVQVERGSSGDEPIAIDFIFSINGSSVTERILDVLDAGATKIYPFDLSYYGKPEKVSVAFVYPDGVGEAVTVSEIPSGSSGGGGGGSPVVVAPEDEDDCVENWSCGLWSNCFASSRTRICTDNNSCGTVVDRPNLSESCEMSTGDWIPPIGIPRPSFGIEENYTMYNNVSNRNLDLNYTENSEGGFYTHYVDNSGGCSNSGNDYGTNETPRCSIPGNPGSLVEGSVVEIHGGPYTGGWIALTGTGTKNKPVFIRGYSEQDKPIFDGFTNGLRTGGSYVIIENLELNNSGVSFHNNYAPHSNITIRNLEIHNIQGVTGSSVGIQGSDIVIYNNHIHNNGQLPGDTQQDHHASGTGNVQRLWLVDNHIHHNRGDSFQVNADPASNANYIYIGRNVMHEDGENAVDVKGSMNVIISQNTMYGYRNYVGSDGVAIVAGHEGSNDVWILFNEIFDSDKGIRANEPETDNKTTYIIGNIIYDISQSAISTWHEDVIYAVNNMVYDVENGFLDTNWAERGASSHFFNNIFMNLKSGNGNHIFVSDHTASDSESDYNFYYQSSGGMSIDWDNVQYDNLGDFNSGTGHGGNSFELDPLLTNVPDYCTRLEYFEYYNDSVIIGEADGKTTLTVPGMNFDVLNLEYKDRVSLTNDPSLMECTDGGSDTTPHCSWLRVEGASGDTITLTRNVTVASGSGVEMTVRYYPFSSSYNEFYVDSELGLSIDDIVEFDYDGVVRTITSIDVDFTSDYNSTDKDRIVFSPALNNDVRPISSICNWGTNNNLVRDFSLQAGSQAINNGVLSDVYQTFYDLYGLNISVDYNNVTRPQGAGWDIGAFEYS